MEVLGWETLPFPHPGGTHSYLSPQGGQVTLLICARFAPRVWGFPREWMGELPTMLSGKGCTSEAEGHGENCPQLSAAFPPPSCLLFPRPPHCLFANPSRRQNPKSACRSECSSHYRTAARRGSFQSLRNWRISTFILWLKLSRVNANQVMLMTELSAVRCLHLSSWRGGKGWMLCPRSVG